MTQNISARQPIDADRHVILSVLAADGKTPAPLEVDPSGNLLVNVAAGGAAGTQYTDGSVTVTHPIGTIPVFNNSGTITAVSAANPLPITGTLTVGGTTDNSAFTAGTSTGTPSMGFYHSTIDAVTDGRSAALAIDAKRNLFNVIRDAAGNARGVNVTAGNALTIDGSAVTQPISAASLPLPSGAATSAKQDTGNTSVASIDTKTPALGQAVAGSSTPVVLPAAQITTLTPPAAITGFALDTTLTGGTQRTKITDGTTVADNVAGDTGQNAIVTTTPRKEVSYSTTTPAAVASTDVSNYRWVSVQITGIGTSGVHAAQISNDNVNWVTIALSYPATPTNTPLTNISAGGVGIYHGPLAARYFRINVTGISAGTASGVIEFFASPTALSGVGTAGSSNINLNAISGINGAAITDAFTGPNVPPISALNSLYNGSAWDRVRSGGVTGMAGVTPQATPSGGASFLNIATGQATTVVKASAGTLYAIILNSAATATNTTVVYDNASGAGTVIGRPAVTTATVPTTLTFGPAGMAFANGLTIITAIANSGDMTVIYK